MHLFKLRMRFLNMLINRVLQHILNIYQIVTSYDEGTGDKGQGIT